MARLAVVAILFALSSVLLVPSTIALLAGERLPGPRVDLPPTPGSPLAGWPGANPAEPGDGASASGTPGTPDTSGAGPLPGDQTVVTVYDEPAQQIRQLPLESYLEGVVAAEMPASFGPAALQAQAVAARTFAVLRLIDGTARCPLLQGAQFCSDGDHGQAWASEAERRRFWGVLAPVYEAKIRQAVQATAGEILVWQGRPIRAYYTASAGGRTASAEEVFGVDLPYLPSLPSPDADRPARLGLTRIPLQEAARRLGLSTASLEGAIPAAGTDTSSASPVAVVARTASGRAAKVRVGDQTVSGERFRQLLGLPSTLIESIRVEGGDLVIRTRGYGHGVGLSQYGAAALAQQGYSSRAILAHYYPGTQVAHLPPGPV